MTMNFTQFRIARPTDQIQLLEQFYCDGVGLEKVGEFGGHRGYPTVPSENPYWVEKGVTIADPYGWRVVLMNTAGI